MTTQAHSADRATTQAHTADRAITHPHTANRVTAEANPAVLRGAGGTAPVAQRDAATDAGVGAPRGKP